MPVPRPSPVLTSAFERQRSILGGQRGRASAPTRFWLKISSDGGAVTATEGAAGLDAAIASVDRSLERDEGGAVSGASGGPHAQTTQQRWRATTERIKSRSSARRRAASWHERGARL